MTYRSYLSSSALALTLALSPSAFAQLDEIVVTSQKREQNIQDVPIAVTAIDNNYIETRQITDIKSLSSLAPNLKVENTPGNSTGAQISIRGGVTINPALTWEPTVGIYLNGSYIGKTQGAVFDVADIERVEVLRGPQGTLYGRNTLAGAINIISAKPTEDFNGSLKVGFGNYNSKLAKGTMNFGQLGPIRAKVSGLLEKRDGFIDVVANPFPGVIAAGANSVNDLENLDKKSFLVALSADLTESITLDYTFDWSDADQRPTFSQIGVQGHNLTATYDSELGELKSITSYRKLSWDDALDLDGSPLPLAHTQRLSDYDSFSQELQLTGGTGRLNYVLGAYYFEDDGFTNNPQFFFGGASVFDSRYGFETTAKAIYGQLDFAISDTLSLTGGLRYTDEEKSIDRTNIAVVFNGLPPNTPFVPAGTTGKTSFDDLSPQITLNYAPIDTINLYAKYANGFQKNFC